MKGELIEILFQYKEAFASDNEPLWAIKGHQVDIMLNAEGPYPTLSRIPAYPAIPRAREALESHINELMKLGVLRKAGNIHKNADGLSRSASPNTPYNPAYVPTGAEPQITIE
ncbi:hypothetical protein O181_051481 [Austropuccinia psidii MF-1]|uniref:Uncharacterized protein n=1 Tax=Austropuccinia psidii MF-1 TaxID=1389203 RepID=A0A9Q3HND7_9BASI|nr:hypothetical protein [Austropuccinia psidii MF-1]